jgi:hypothetical protein
MEYPVSFGEQFNLTYKLNIKNLFIPQAKDLSKPCRVFFSSYMTDAQKFSNFSQMNKCHFEFDAGKRTSSQPFSILQRYIMRAIFNIKCV